MHDVSLISLMAIGLGVAMLLGLLAQKLKLPPLVGYLLAGVIIGPATPGFTADLSLAQQLSELGVMLLMFGVGLHFSLNDLLQVRRIAVPGAIVQITAATLLGMIPALWWGWSWGSALVFGLCLSVASTVVLLRALEDRGLLNTSNGRIAVGWLVVEDLVMVLVLVLLPPLAVLLGGQADPHHPPSSLPVWQSLGLTLFKVAAFIALMLGIGRRLFPKLLWWIAATGSRELFTLAVIVSAITLAYVASSVFGVSLALGAFFAGMVMRESEFSHRAAAESLPMRDAFAVLFFVAVGMLFDPAVLWEHPMSVLAVTAVIMIGKTLAAGMLVLLMRYPLNTALTVSVALAQIGEFSFILAGLGMSLKLLDQHAQSLILAGAMISISLNALLFSLTEPARLWILGRSALARRLEQRTDPLSQLPYSVDESYLTNQIVVVGYGAVGQALVQQLQAQAARVVVIESQRELVEQLREQAIPAVRGNAAEPATLVQAHIHRASQLLVTRYESTDVPHMLENCQLLNPALQIIFISRSDEESALLAQHTAVTVVQWQQVMAQYLAALSRTSELADRPASAGH